MSEPFQDECTNPGYTDKYTTPCCYVDIYEGEGLHACPKCERPVVCSEETQPMKVCRLVDDEQ